MDWRVRYAVARPRRGDRYVALWLARSLCFVRAVAGRPPPRGLGAPDCGLGRRKIALRRPGGTYYVRHLGEEKAPATRPAGACLAPLGASVGDWTHWSPEFGPTMLEPPTMKTV